MEHHFGCCLPKEPQVITAWAVRGFWNVYWSRNYVDALIFEAPYLAIVQCAHCPTADRPRHASVLFTFIQLMYLYWNHIDLLSNQARKHPLLPRNNLISDLFYLWYLLKLTKESLGSIRSWTRGKASTTPMRKLNRKSLSNNSWSTWRCHECATKLALPLAVAGTDRS